MSNHDQIQAQYWDQAMPRIATVKMTDVAKREIENFFNFINLENKHKILEIGCGTGRFTIPLLAKGYEVTATEVSVASLKKLAQIAQHKKLAERLTLKKTSFQKPIFCNQFDLVICGCVVHHFHPTYKKRIIANMAYALKNRGVIALFEPNAYHPLYLPWYLFLELSGKEKGVWQAEKGLFQSTSRSLKKMLQQAGFTKIKAARHTLIPLRLSRFLKAVEQINQKLETIPLIKNLSAYLWIKGEKVSFKCER